MLREQADAPCISSSATCRLTARAALIATFLTVSAITLLTGCATDQNALHTSYDDQYYRDSDGASWPYARDPIGEFMARQRSAHIKVNPDDIHDPLARQALTQLGIRYRFGGKSPDTGFDCSGLVFYSAQESLGLKLPPRSDDMAKLGSNIERNQLRVGDLVFFNTMGRRFSHVGVYLGDSKFVHSPASGGVVRIEDINERYWDKRFTGARRLEGAEFASANTGAGLNDSSPISITTSKAVTAGANASTAGLSQSSTKTRQTSTVKDKKATSPAKTAKADASTGSAKSGKSAESSAAIAKPTPTTKPTATAKPAPTANSNSIKPKTAQTGSNPAGSPRQP